MVKNKQTEGVSTEAPAKVTVKKSVKNQWNTTIVGIIGIGELLTIVSIAYSTTVIVLGTEGIVPIIMISPAVVFALVILIKKFIKK